ncbi:MAG: tRNA adenosine deaminase-associated protein [Aeromicrobium sp.]|uniref:tRNA adenosine deaminase-associated protein n=1 Tax=Aeromicrobium sp. TaxID=1871063 RepID=UPI003C537F36
MAEDDVDFVVAAYRADDAWHVAELKTSLGYDLEELGEALARFRSDDGVFGLLSVDEDWFAILRREGTRTRWMLSDVTVVSESALAGDVADAMDLREVDDDEDPQPGGDLEILSDLGVSAAVLVDVCDDDVSLPADLLLELAELLGFADDLEEVLD